MRIEHTYTEPDDVARGHLDELRKNGLVLEGKRVLDAGCGTGTYARMMAGYGASYVLGIDNAQMNIETANLVNGAPNVKFLCADIEDWETGEKFDLVFMRGAIYYLKGGIEQTIASLAGLLSPDGEMFITFMNKGARAVIINTIKKMAAAAPGVFRPAVKTVVAGTFYLLTLLAGRGRADWALIKDKANTVFFPVRHMNDLGTVKDILDEQGFYVSGIFRGQGQNPGLTDDYGVWVKSRKNLKYH